MKKLNRLAMFGPVVMAVATTTLSAAEIGKAERDENAKQVAKTWVVSWLQGETAVTTSLSAVPFSLDGKRNIETISELKAVYDELVKKNGKMKLKPKSIEIAESSMESVVVRITIPDDDEGGNDDETINITVKPGHASYVVGFVD